MESVLVKVLAVVLALSQVSTRPDDVKTHFDDTADRTQVLELLRAGCDHMRKVFKVENLPLDDLVETALADPKIATSKVKEFHGLNFADLDPAYRELCKNEMPDPTPVDLAAIIDFYDKAAANLPDASRLKGLKLASPSEVLDARKAHFAELYEPGNRRVAVPLSQIPDFVQRAFISAEDQRFFEHKGIDERGLVRAFVVNMMQPGRPQGGSTITQQMVKNVLVGDDVTYERKVREILVTAKVEQILTKQEILELYLNSIYFGRNSWGVEMAARSYFGKSIKDVTLAEGALLAGLVKGPNYFSPERAPDRARERLDYVLGRMKEDGVITADQLKQNQDKLPRVIPVPRRRREASRYFFDYLTREIKTVPGLAPLANATYTIHSTIYPALQSATEAALQEGLAQYEIDNGRVDFKGPEANLADAVKQIDAARAAALTPTDAATPPAAPATTDSVATSPPGSAPSSPSMPDWQQALSEAYLPLLDVHWTPAIVIPATGPTGSSRRGEGIRVGLADGRVLPLHTGSAAIERRLQLYDVVFVRVVEANGRVKGRVAARADLRVRPTVEGAAIVLENKTGRILAMAGGFSYGVSQLNRTAQTQRQPGSTVKPLTYLAALRAGLQPNTLIRDEPVTLPPINGSDRERDYWSPRSYGGNGWGVVTLRRALENSRNLATAGLLDGGIDQTPELSLDRVCELAEEAQLYAKCQHYYPIVLGAQPVRMIDLAAFYAAIANEGARPAPHAIASVEEDGRTVWRDDRKPPVWLGSADRASFYQLKSMLQGVVARGTAASMRDLAPYIAGKTGTSEDENDAWFAGFSNDVTVVVWVGYDNGNGRRTLGGGETGGHVAVPIFRQIIEASWADYAPRTPLAPPSAEARRNLVLMPVDLASGSRVTQRGPGTIIEAFRRDPDGQVDDTQYRIVSELDASTTYPRDDDQQQGYPYGQQGNGYYGNNGQPYYNNGQPYQPNPYYNNGNRGLFGGWFNNDPPPPPQQPPRVPGQANRAPVRPVPERPYDYQGSTERRYDPDYFWNNRTN
ncbi:MAG TPA: transglycosylase domain-containing protein [Xanthobacteraceae bacterium]|nr:transglycosylase domain-containing protein [Xanthobacteraceae bacterium]